LQLVAEMTFPPRRDVARGTVVVLRGKFDAVLFGPLPEGGTSLARFFHPTHANDVNEQKPFSCVVFSLDLCGICVKLRERKRLR
jgi:hypothetical protein